MFPTAQTLKAVWFCSNKLVRMVKENISIEV